ncbi:MAG: hypothetical protein BWY77_01070 [bacterium ADurb.Bin431]|nr:MAG: hypothetical protein BWY77_01070 [bacterium ADurb.Bin431]
MALEGWLSGAKQPASCALAQNYPNPFNGETRLEFALDRPGHITLTIQSVRGEQIAALAAGQFPAGVHSVTWLAGSLPSGLYFARLTHEDKTITKRMLLIK